MQAIHQPLHRQKPTEQRSSQTPGPNRGKKPDFRAMVQNKEMQSALGSGLLMLIAWGTAPYFGTLSIMLYIVAYAVGGGPRRRKASRHWSRTVI